MNQCLKYTKDFTQDMTFRQRLWQVTHDGPDLLFPSMTPFAWRNNTHHLQAFTPYIATDGLDTYALENHHIPYTALLCQNWHENLSFQRMYYQRFNAGLLPARLSPSKVIKYEQASMATQVTPPSDLSSITKVLPFLSPDDLRTFQTNIASLLDNHDAPGDDDDAKMDSIPN